jgi:hypothetical protein
MAPSWKRSRKTSSIPGWRDRFAAAADQKIVQSRRAVEIETLNAHAEVEPLVALAAQLKALQASGPEALQAYVRNVRLQLYAQAHQVILQEK